MAPPKNQKSQQAVPLTVCSPHEYYKLWEGQPPRTFHSWEMTPLNFEWVTFFLKHPLSIFPVSRLQFPRTSKMPCSPWSFYSDKPDWVASMTYKKNLVPEYNNMPILWDYPLYLAISTYRNIHRKCQHYTTSLQCHAAMLPPSVSGSSDLCCGNNGRPVRM